jgi:hypothetical protein
VWILTLWPQTPSEWYLAHLRTLWFNQATWQFRLDTGQFVLEPSEQEMEKEEKRRTMIRMMMGM